MGPEGPLAAGLADALAAAGVPCFGPSRSAAALESSKAFAKAFMARHGLPTARFGTFRDLAAAEAFVRGCGFRVVVKCSGLAAGKGVLLPETEEEALAAVRLVMGGGKGGFGEAGREVSERRKFAGQGLRAPSVSRPADARASRCGLLNSCARSRS